MPEGSFRYVRTERANAWKQAGWSVISGPLSMQPPVGLEGDGSTIDVVIMEWQQSGQPVEPNETRRQEGSELHRRRASGTSEEKRRHRLGH